MQSFVIRVSNTLFKQGNRRLSRLTFPNAARKMDTLNDLLAASDLISLHCALTTETIQIINADCLKYIKPGKLVVNCLQEFLFECWICFDVYFSLNMRITLIYRSIPCEYW